MRRWFQRLLGVLALSLLLSSPSSADAPSAPDAAVGKAASPARVLVIPVRQEIDDPVLYILRRGLKNAAQGHFDAVVLDMNTPGGNLGVTLEILDAIEKFPGYTATYVNKEALSAGAFISAMTRDIYFAPNGVIGAAAPVSSGGADIDKTMKEKLVSYMKARVRSLSEGKGPYRAEVVSAMMDADGEFKLGDKVLKKDGKLLTLTAQEAMETYGTPAVPLLGAGIHGSISELLDQKYGKNGYTVENLEVTWSERAASWLSSVKSILMGLGLLAIFIEFKLQGHGLFALVGLLLLGVVFVSGYIAGLSGYEPAIVFGIGLVLLLLEVFVLPGVVFLAVLGLVLMGCGLLWSLADFWPSEPISVAWSSERLIGPIKDLGLGLLVAFGGGAAVIAFVPRRWLWHNMVLEKAVEGASGSPEGGLANAPVVGSAVVAVTPLRPSGEVEFAGRRFPARIEIGTANAGDHLVVRGRSGFEFIVEKA